MRTLKQIEAEQRENLREIRRLRLRLSTAAGRNVGATEAALDRRQARDRELIREAAEADVEFAEGTRVVVVEGQLAGKTGTVVTTSEYHRKHNQRRVEFDDRRMVDRFMQLALLAELERLLTEEEMRKLIEERAHDLCVNEAQMWGNVPLSVRARYLDAAEAELREEGAIT